MYYFMFALGFVFLIWYTFHFYHVYNISRKRALWYSLTFIYGILGANIMGRIFTAICVALEVREQSRLAIFGAVIFAPLLILLTVDIEKRIRRIMKAKNIFSDKNIENHVNTISGRNTLDLLTPGLFITIALGKIGCLIEGCCFGIECTWGVYSNRVDATVFPVQLFESVTLFLILVGCHHLKRKKFYRRGMAYPITAILYCLSRFVFEYFRYYNPVLRNLVFGVTLWQSLCIVVIFVSIISLVFLYKEESDPLLPLSFKP